MSSIGEARSPISDSMMLMEGSMATLRKTNKNVEKLSTFNLKLLKLCTLIQLKS